MALRQNEPRLIQRCYFEDDALRYDYMGSAEFEAGDQTRSLRRMFAVGELVKRSAKVFWIPGREMTIWMVAAPNFDFEIYGSVIQGLIERKWGLQEGTYLDEEIERMLDHDYARSERRLSRTEAWFDFVNDVFFVLDKNKAKKLTHVLARVKELWSRPDPPEIANAKRELETLKAELRAAGLHWFSLDRVKKMDAGEIRVWLNPVDQRRYHCGWFTFAELRDWGSGYGPAVMERAAQ